MYHSGAVIDLQLLAGSVTYYRSPYVSMPPRIVGRFGSCTCNVSHYSLLAAYTSRDQLNLDVTVRSLFVEHTEAILLFNAT